MDDLQRRIVEDLTGVLRGEVRCDAVTTAIYGVDASLYQIRPIGVVYPYDAADVRMIARYASEQKLPLVPRGGGTNVSGGSVGTGLVVDFSRSMTRILVDDGETIRVEPGVVLERLNRRLRPTGRYFPPDPATAAVTTIGGMIATNAAGSHSVRVGTTRDHVSSIETVLVDGGMIEAGRESLDDSATSSDADDAQGGESRKRSLRNHLTNLLVDNADLIESKRPRSKRNNCGYRVWDVLTSTHLDLAGLLVGSEGTLGLFSAATLKLSPLPEHRGVTLLLFGSTEAAFDAVQKILPLQPAACDLIDRRLLSLAREGDARFEAMITAEAEAALLVEVVGESAASAGRRIGEIVRLTSDTSRAVARATT
ncbi:MAG: FAD-binding oxidoreductase, partial [Planctomycetaceae bacterium]